MPEAAGQVQSALPARGSLLCFDFGLARIGVAVGELENRQANPLLTIHEASTAARFAAIEALIVEWRPVGLVVGMPTHLDGTEHVLTRRCRRFANQLRGRHALPVLECDERLSSVAADAVLREAGQESWRTRKSLLDAVAAQLILQHFLDSLDNDRS